MKNENNALLTALAECAAACNMCLSGCLADNDPKMNACIKLDIDCAQICSTTADFVARNSDHAQHLLKECAEICGKCAAECEKHSQHHDHCKACAEACRKCEQACKSGK